MAFKIIAGYDGSEGAKTALEEALRLARDFSAQLSVVYAYGGPKTYGGAPLTPRRMLKDLGEKALSEAVARAAAEGVTATPVLVDDDAVEGLMDVARAQQADIIVAGSHGESPIRGGLLGSTAYQLVHRATRPVLIVPGPKQARKAA
jgi:nucleotide-binding universal stress UspA family protein